ncbi:hypothetical protein [Roseateles albus]|uniref:Uncharacterized protein n=1 Tax=Roseateles albus TaxID=2987525 RepID=A0ABT5KB41_9BURK|nr:hypothetical protein [Roseateles albus]MDC8770654.1 hypothetical protein [Roseateles albus]
MKQSIRKRLEAQEARQVAVRRRTSADGAKYHQVLLHGLGHRLRQYHMEPSPHYSHAIVEVVDDPGSPYEPALHAMAGRIRADSQTDADRALLALVGVELKLDGHDYSAAESVLALDKVLSDYCDLYPAPFSVPVDA